MAWTPLASRLSTLPHLLAGPVLRQVTPTSVSVWLVLRTPLVVQLCIYPSGTATQPLLSSPLQQATKVGDSLYVTVVTARTSSPMTSGIVYYYDLWFFMDGGPQSLAQAAGAGEVTYHNAPRPSFSLPPASREALRLFHASCRKPRSRGSRDALMLVGDIIADSLDDANARPHQLFLTGDQIYADTVPDALLMMISDAAMTLVGDESVPFGANRLAPLRAGPGGAYALPRGAATLVTLEEERYVIASTFDLAPRLDIVGAVGRGDAERALDAYLATHPAARGTLQVVPRFEIEALLP